MDQLFEMIIGSDIAEIPEISARLDAGMQMYGFRAEDILDTQLAVEEAITNVIFHGYRKTGGKIGVTCHISPVAWKYRSPMLHPVLTHYRSRNRNWMQVSKIGRSGGWDSILSARSWMRSLTGTRTAKIFWS